MRHFSVQVKQNELGRLLWTAFSCLLIKPTFLKIPRHSENCVGCSFVKKWFSMFRWQLAFLLPLNQNINYVWAHCIQFKVSDRHTQIESRTFWFRVRKQLFHTAPQLSRAVLSHRNWPVRCKLPRLHKNIRQSSSHFSPQTYYLWLWRWFNLTPNIIYHKSPTKLRHQGFSIWQHWFSWRCSARFCLSPLLFFLYGNILPAVLIDCFNWQFAEHFKLLFCSLNFHD